ncbi:MAG: alkane 1-monooxygenase [Pseudomonadota bacterium]
MSMQPTSATQPDVSRADLARFSRAMPFWMSLALVPLAWFCAVQGGWVIALLPVATWGLFSLLDAVLGEDPTNADPNATDQELIWYRAVTLIWVPAQALTLFGLLWYVPQAAHLSGLERVAMFFGVGVLTGTIGINYSHELMHQSNKLERWLADILLAMVLYSHFRSEHLLVHHTYVGTPRDPVTARYNEGFHRYYPRVLWQSLTSAFAAEARKLARGGKGWTDRRNPFWRYWLLQLLCMALAFGLGGWPGIILFLVQAGAAIWQLELINYIEHYGLTRKHLGNGRYEHVGPHHSWNATHTASNWLLINLQRHSDHHFNPRRRFPVLQSFGPEDAPQLPYGSAVMTVAAMIPPLWRRMMNPRVRAWRAKHYPEITDWAAYNGHQTPMPR